jgi:flagellar protein FliO/FliZ
MAAPELLRVVFGFVAVLAMIGLTALAAKKAGLASIAGGIGGKRRLAVREMLPLDARRRLAIVKCDDTEYLIILGVSGETIVDKSLAGAAAEDRSEPALAVNPFSDFASRLRVFASGVSRKDAA